MRSIRFDQFDRMGWDGWLGQTLLSGHALQALEGRYQDRLAMATLAFMPYVVLLREHRSDGDMALIDAMQPSGYNRALWGWLVEENARRLFRSERFHAAFAEAVDRIERQLADA